MFWLKQFRDRAKALDRLEEPGMEPGTQWSRDMIFATMCYVRLANAQTSLLLRAV